MSVKTLKAPTDRNAWIDIEEVASILGLDHRAARRAVRKARVRERDLSTASRYLRDDVLKLRDEAYGPAVLAQRPCE